MSDVVKFLTENPVQYLATIGLDGKPKVRPFQFMIEHNGKLYFSTSNQKNLYKQIKRQPYVELSVSSPAPAWIRLSGKVVFSKDMDIKRIETALTGLIVRHESLRTSFIMVGDEPVQRIHNNVEFEMKKGTGKNLSKVFWGVQGGDFTKKPPWPPEAKTLQNRGPGTPSQGREHPIYGPHRFPGETAGLPDRIGGNRNTAVGS